MDKELIEEKTDIFIEGINIELLRQQRNELNEVIENLSRPRPTFFIQTIPFNPSLPLLEGIVAMLDAMLDVAEGYEELAYPEVPPDLGH